MTYDNSNRGSIFRNEKRDPVNPDPRDADFTGSLNVVCPHCSVPADYFVDAYKRKEGANPKAPPLSFRVKAKTKQRRHDPISTGRGDVPF